MSFIPNPGCMRWMRAEVTDHAISAAHPESIDRVSATDMFIK